MGSLVLHIPILGPALGQLESLSVTRDDLSDFFEIGSRGSNPVPCLPDTLDSTNVTRRVGRRRNGLADLWLKRKGNATPMDPRKGGQGESFSFGHSVTALYGRCQLCLCTLREVAGSHEVGERGRQAQCLTWGHAMLESIPKRWLVLLCL